MTATVTIEAPARLPLPMRISMRIGGTAAEAGVPVRVDAGPTVVEFGIAGRLPGGSFAGTARLPIEVHPGAHVRIALPSLGTATATG